MNAIVEDPSDRALNEHLEELRREFSLLFNEHQHMVTYEHDDLLVRHLLLFGQLEIEASNLDMSLRALRMKVGLAQASVNRDKAPDVDAIEAKVAVVYREYQEKISKMKSELDVANNATSISINDAKERDSLHKYLVKKLHPDLHPDLPKAYADLFLRVQAAYKSFDLDTLRKIAIKLDSDQEVPIPEKDISAYISQLEKQILHMREEIARLNTSYPFNLREKLVDEAWVAQQQLALNGKISNLQAVIKDYQLRYELLLEWKPD